MYGESQKLASAVFTLAEKLKPCIIFIDEIDTFLRSRGRNDHEVTAMMKAQFMIQWDGLCSSMNNQGVIVLGATNRPQDVDVAILRRMPAMFSIPLPNLDQRKAVLQLLLKNEPLEDDIDIGNLAELTDDFSGSDLKELCRSAVFAHFGEESDKILKLFSNSKNLDLDSALSDIISKLRNVTFEDFSSVVKSIKENKCSYSRNEI
jgi:SpoVK/Ycf46/Vps4 family AAA+-type ATPase